MNEVKTLICTGAGVIGGFIAAALGGWDLGLQTLLIFMAADYITGLIVAGVFGRSKKTATGRITSGVCFKGLLKKGAILIYVLVGYRLDLLIGCEWVRNTVIIGFVCSEAISITENLGLMGVPMPKYISKAIELLTEKAEKGAKSNGK